VLVNKSNRYCFRPSRRSSLTLEVQRWSVRRCVLDSRRPWSDRPVIHLTPAHLFTRTSSPFNVSTPLTFTSPPPSTADTPVSRTRCGRTDHYRTVHYVFNYVGLITSSPVGGWSTAITQRVSLSNCLFVCLSVCLSLSSHIPKTTCLDFLCVLAATVARSFSDDGAIR